MARLRNNHRVDRANVMLGQEITHSGTRQSVAPLTVGAKG
jgi:hypothetical protein